MSHFVECETEFRDPQALANTPPLICDSSWRARSRAS